MMMSALAHRLFSLPAAQSSRFISSTASRCAPPPKSAFSATWESLNEMYPVRKVEAESMDKLWSRYSQDAVDQAQNDPPHTPFTGRSVQVRDGDTNVALNKLRGILSRNNTLREWIMAERHEKRGVKRRRLSSERWRRVFANEVRKKVQLVSDIQHRNRLR